MPSASPAIDEAKKMFRRIFAAALGAGIGIGVLAAALQHVALVPLILEAEKYENATAAPEKHGQAPNQWRAVGVGLPGMVSSAHAHDGQAPDKTAEAPSPWRAVW